MGLKQLVGMEMRKGFLGLNMSKCPSCVSCLKSLQVGNSQYKFCALCGRVWSLSGRLLVEIFDTEHEAYLAVRRIMKNEPL